METDRYRELADRARAGDPTARQELLGDHLPLVYNIVGRALDGHPDTDDVVQDTMLRAVDGLPALREPGSFRSWLVAIAMNQVRRRHQARQAGQPDGLDELGELPDPAGDFAELTIVRLGLSGQRREVAEATRWLDGPDREVLALWWQEAAGQLSRAELAAALELSPQHAAVRVQRVKERLDGARTVVRALAARPGCPVLAELTAGWDGAPAPLWRKRITRHVRDCADCQEPARGLVPAEGLLAGLALLLPPPHLAVPALQPAGAVTVVGAGRHRPGPSGRRARQRGRAGVRRRRIAVAALGAVVAVSAAGLLWEGQSDGGATGTPLAAADPAPPQSSASPVQVDAASVAPAPAPPSSPAPAPSTSQAVPTRRGDVSATQADYVRQVLDLVNTQRAQAGCGPLATNGKLQLAAQRQSDDMASRGFFDHTNPDGAGPQQRIEAAGYQWSTWGENIARGQRDPASVMASWMDSPGHRANILNCDYRELGVGVHFGTGGPWWTQDFGAPA
ncbi:sigma-70 family RNA polymerase sigma factor [Kitasatospora viridis]|uniref:RNA polymerase sigma factor (Sigma-70 family) n=1 Tax=Kitasatospora viridis TaxID=281105 RepID=A0A561UBF6_9ACTN|nr:sigma-70 family RNA polymerase sigma factor [Kitasatospora viridis]TWF96697.1 RNA polymerase sigma factor (sigma-70 family) [Kitasatospora viridis]